MNQSATVATSSRTAALPVGGDRTPTTERYRVQQSWDRGPQVPTSAVIVYRGVRGLKHRNEQRLPAQSATTPTVADRGSRTNSVRVMHTQPPQQHGSSSSDQPRPVQSTSSRRRSMSADRQAAISSTPRTLYETLYHDKVCHTVAPEP